MKMDLHNKESLRRKMKRRKDGKFPSSSSPSCCWLYEKSSVIFHKFSGHQLSNISSFNDFTKLMNSDVDAASLGVGRALFGLMMLLDIPEERSGDLDLRWGMPKDCRFSLFSFIKPLSFPKMGLVYFAMWLGALGITLGYKFKSSCFLFVLTYWYIFLLDLSSWNNHSYLYGLVAFIFLFTGANRYFSIDGLGVEGEAKVPFWNYFLLKFQFFVLYFIAGWKKFSSEWLIEWQFSMSNLSSHSIFTPFRYVLGNELTDQIMIHWFAAVFDTSITFFLIYEKSRPIAMLFSIAFHVMNSRLFHIGMFPWVCLVELPLFCEHKWPRTFTFWRKLKCSTPSTLRTNANDKNVTAKQTLRERFTTFLILIYCCLQLFLPFSHFLTLGYNGHVDGIYGYSFDMMMQNWHPSIISVKIVDNNLKQTHFIEPLAFTDSLRWTQYPNMAYQYSQCIRENLINDFHDNPHNSVLTSKNFSIYFDIWYSLNGRFHQRIYDPRVDFTNTQWHPFQTPTFTLPLLKEYSHLRSDIKRIRKDVEQWNNHTNLLFFADFPQLTFENYIMPEMENVTLHVLLGAVRFQQENETDDVTSLSQGQSVSVNSGQFHKITTISEFPSCFYYTFSNVTFERLKDDADEDENFFHSRYENYKNFVYHIANSLLFEFYNVPMPRRIREIHDM